MASSQVEIASSSLPFGCVLRDRNQRDVCRESKWRKVLVKDRLNANISFPSDRNENENSWHPNTLRVNRTDKVKLSAAMNPSHSTPSSAKKAKTERKSTEETPNLGAASLVQIWENRLGKRPNSSDSEDSDRTAPASEQLSPCRSQGSDMCESERIRVIDIIRRLAGANQSNENSEQSGSPASSDEQRIFSQAILSPRIRGRQAFADLLMQMERERHRELNTLIDRRPVSRFPQRGRIQSMLRLRSLQRGLAVQDQHRLRIASSSHVDRPPQQASSIPHLRERFSTKAENVVTSQNEETENVEKSSASTVIDEETQNREVLLTEKQDKTRVLDNSACTLSKEPCLTTSLTCQETSLDDRNLDWQETSLSSRDLDLQQGVEATDLVTTCDGWNENYGAIELEDNYSQYAEETSYDWINDISRPRRYWEDLRKEWYHEVLNSNSKNGDIRQLLERGTVSGFLASEFRERMDRLLESRLERQIQHGGSTKGEESQHQRGLESNEETVEEDSSIRSWNEANDDSDRTSPVGHSRLQSYYHREQHSSSSHHPSIEIELICELRSQMELLSHEMSDLRKSLKSCMDMQMVLMQQSLKPELHSASGEAVQKKGNCRICYQMKIDTLLYRCGHMCTCLKCAHELQWSSGKCPICSAEIVDVVRAYLDP